MSYEVPPLVASPDQPMEVADSMHALASCCTLFADCSFLAPIAVVGLGTQPPGGAWDNVLCRDWRIVLRRICAS